MVHASFGANAENISKLLKILFAVQYPIVNITSGKQAPNHKLYHLFPHLIKVSTKTFEPGLNISSNKKYESFQGHHHYKHQVTLKSSGDRFFIDEVCEEGYTINFYPGNLTPPKNWIEKGYSKTHS